MLTPINIAIAILWALSALIDAAYFVYLWQLKEYRLDQFKVYLRSADGRQLWFQYQLLWRSIIAIIIFLWPINAIIFVKWALVSLFVVDILFGVYRLWQRQLRRPVVTSKSVLIIALAISLEGILFLFSGDWAVLFLLMIVRIGTVSTMVWLINIPTWLAKRWFINKARRKLSRYPNMIVIGITGSYGKTTCKEFTAHILSQQFCVTKTPAHVNTEIGVARHILQTDFTDVDVYVVEMGAYKKGEIGLIADMVQPKIGVLTAIIGQHLATFGSIENIQKAKFELLQSLPQDGLAITNADNAYCRELLDTVSARVQTFGTDTEYSPTLCITDIDERDGYIHAKGVMQGKEREIDAPIVGAYNVFNIAPATLVARELGMKSSAIRRGIATLPRNCSPIQIYSYGKATIIDDSYNSNPQGFKAALDIMSSYPSQRRRVVITRGMNELGAQHGEIHEQMGGEIAFVADDLVVALSPDALPYLKAGVGDKYHTTVRYISDSQELSFYLEELKQQDVVILLENRLHSRIDRMLAPYKTAKHE